MSRPSRLTRFFRWVWPNAGRPGVMVRQDGVHVVLRASEFRTVFTPENAMSLARGIAEAAHGAELERARRQAGGAP